MPLTLQNIPGFADQSDAILAADTRALGFKLARISSNAAFGMCRLEVFQGSYKDGDTVPLPVSDIDGYQYSRSELLYLWAPAMTGDPAKNWASYGPPYTLWYVAYTVDQATGAVACSTGYRGNNDHKDRQASSNDGLLNVWTIAQRNKTTLTLASLPGYSALNDSDFHVDEPLYSSQLVAMNESAKYGVVNQEVIYMGVFKNGDTVPLPVSPADGYVYTYPEASFLTCVRWTADDDGTNLKIPDIGKGQLSDWAFAVSSTGVVSCTVKYELGSITSYTTGRCAVFAFCTRAQLTLLGTLTLNDVTPYYAAPWNQIFNSSLPYTGSGPDTEAPGFALTTYGLAAGDTIRIVVTGSITGPAGTTTDGQGLAIPANPTGYSTGPGQYIPSGTTLRHGRYGCIGTFVKDGGPGHVISIISIGKDSGFITIPALTLGINVGIEEFSSYAATSGSYTVKLYRLETAAHGDLADSFAEIDDSVFFPGETLRVTTMQQLAANIREAASTPEFFGPAEYQDGDTVPRPTSPIDGYVYTRDELTYVWDWSDTGPDLHSTDRMVMAVGHVDNATGAVSASQYRFDSGASNWHIEATGKLRVLTFAKREAEITPITAPVVAPVDGTIDDSNGEITVDGV